MPKPCTGDFKVSNGFIRVPSRFIRVKRSSSKTKCQPTTMLRARTSKIWTMLDTRTHTEQKSDGYIEIIARWLDTNDLTKEQNTQNEFYSNSRFIFTNGYTKTTKH